MDNSSQVPVLKRALELTKSISISQKQLNNLESARFKDPPEQPKRVVYKSQYPEVKSALKQNIATVLGGPITMYLRHKDKQQDEERIRNSPEYLMMCKQIDAETEQKQKQADLEFEQQMQHWENTLMPAYNAELAEWTKKREESILNTEAALDNYKAELQQHYEETKIVPMQYREIEALEYIYNMISTSDYSVKEAIELYDRDKQRKLDEERLYQQRLLNEKQQQANELAAENAALMEEQNYIADKARRQANTAATVAAIQRHNLNKKFKK